MFLKIQVQMDLQDRPRKIVSWIFLTLKIDCSNLYYIFPFLGISNDYKYESLLFWVYIEGTRRFWGWELGYSNKSDWIFHDFPFSLHVLMNLHFPFLPNASIILVWSWPKFRHPKSQKWKVSRCITQPTSNYNQITSPTWKIFKYGQCPTLIYTNSIKQALGCFVRLSSSLPL